MQARPQETMTADEARRVLYDAIMAGVVVPSGATPDPTYDVAAEIRRVIGCSRTT